MKDEVLFKYRQLLDLTIKLGEKCIYFQRILQQALISFLENALRILMKPPLAPEEQIKGDLFAQSPFGKDRDCDENHYGRTL